MNQLKIGDFEINYIYEDQFDNRPLVLFLHGFDDSLRTFTRLFNAKEYRSAAIDFPGCSKSISHKSDIKIEDFQHVALSFVDTVLKDEKQIYLVSHSLGSASALYCLKNSLKVKHAILLSPFNFLLVDSFLNYENLKKWLLPNNLEEAKESYINLFYKIPQASQNNLEKIASNILNRQPLRRKYFAKMVNEEILNEFYLHSYIREFFNQNRYTIITGLNDNYVTLDSLENIQQNYFDIPIVCIPNAGHALVYEAEDIVKNSIIKIINDTNKDVYEKI
ncbi:alpha/beta fold hydrolase [Mycoplasmopsis ciconiae]|uniref:Alpha/beta fold hydrolase n=1 Tax=Mycoplasmopsis ciconiae TaxID=561067 RepID=A0ABU7ML50_9BACT|nr:alpha/beta fold hydrolase [Mycoplasmopsis ciconiae]